jgi:hypothetical protein
MLLAGTVAFPSTFPELGVLSFECHAARADGVNDSTGDVLKVEQFLSPKLTMTRTFLASDVAAVFLPAKPERVDLRDGKWLLGDEVAKIADASKCDHQVLGIVYVREQASTLLQVEIGMTAAESAEYYPPLPDDRSVNHYRFENPAGASPTGFGPPIFDCHDEHRHGCQ